MRNKLLMLLVSLTFSIFVSCKNSVNSSDNNSNPPQIKTGFVFFFNESSYSIVIHKDAFSGPVLAELGVGQSKTVTVAVSDNYGIGTTFSVEFKHKVVDGFDIESGEIWANGIDPNIQLTLTIEENKSYTVQIAQPAKLEFPVSFMKIHNTSSRPCELRRLGMAIKQSGNGNLSVPSGKIGVYQLQSSNTGVLMESYSVNEAFNAVEIPAFTSKNGFIYTFTYNGSTITKTSEQSINF